jgi:hypothetical protein
MRDFESSRSRAAQLSSPAKLLYTVFAGLNLIGLLSAVPLYDGIVHFGVRATPSDLYRGLLAHYASYPSLLATTPAHLFSMSVLLLVSGHLMLLTSASPQLKNWTIGAGSASVALHLIAPWLIRWGGGRAATGLIYPISGGIMLLSLGLMTALPVWEMWRPRVGSS